MFDAPHIIYLGNLTFLNFMKFASYRWLSLYFLGKKTVYHVFLKYVNLLKCLAPKEVPSIFDQQN